LILNFWCTFQLIELFWSPIVCHVSVGLLDLYIFYLFFWTAELNLTKFSKSHL
jgi:hypothetical protein